MKKELVVFLIFFALLVGCSGENELINIEPKKECWVKFYTAGGGFIRPKIIEAGEKINLSVLVQILFI